MSTVCTHRMSGCQLTGATPIMAHDRGVSVSHAGGEGEAGVETEANRECGVVPQPLCELSAPPSAIHRQPKARARSNGTCSRNM